MPNARPSSANYVWLTHREDVLDQVLVSLVDNGNGTATWIAECGVRQGCFAGSVEGPAQALILLTDLREQYDETFGEAAQS